MPTPSPYRSLPAERRLALVAHAIASSREGRALYVQRLTSRGGGFRAVTLNGWRVEKLAGEIVRMKAETPQDELDLLHLLYVEIDPAIQITFLDSAGVAHDHGRMDDQLQPPYADEPSVHRAGTAVLEHHGDDGARYLRTLARYSLDAWPGIDTIVGGLQA